MEPPQGRQARGGTTLTAPSTGRSWAAKKRGASQAAFPAARAGVAAWIEDYNTVRRHSALRMMSPVQYEQDVAGGEAA